MAATGEETLVARISRVLAERIIAGEIQPGTKLRQDHVATEFGASHVPVREAFRRLEAQGLAVSEPRRGVRVATFDGRQVREVAEMRAALEVLALRHAAPHLTSAILDAAERAAREADGATDVQVWEEANRRFHRTLLAPCRMARLLGAIDDLHSASARFLFATWRTEWEAREDADHKAILSALRQGQADTATAILHRHVQRVGPRSAGAAGQSLAPVG